jgi:N-acetylmuramic acid 6-phosphate (MurNAc-6-P) etherase
MARLLHRAKNVSTKIMSLTEASSTITSGLDACSAEEIVELLRRCNDDEMFPALQDPNLLAKLDRVAKVLRDDEHSILILSGCGTSGRIAMFCSLAYESARVRYCISGGDAALRLPVENAEDNANQGVADLVRVAGNDARIVFVGITCGFSAPYVAGQLDHALRHRERFVEVVLLGFNPVEAARNVPIENWPEGTFLTVARRVQAEGTVLNPLVGPEPVTGSTRMKGGSATKIMLDCIWNRVADGHHSTAELVRRYREECNRVYLNDNQQQLAALIRAGSEALFAGKSILYVCADRLAGALAVIDASECPPTFGAVPDNVRAYLRGTLFGATGICVDKDFAPRPSDCVVVIESSDAAATLALVERAKAAKANVHVLTGFQNGKDGKHLEHMKLKLSLNAISTGAFVLFGKVYGNRMLDLRLSNNKLYFRAISIVKEIARVDDATAKLCVWKSVYRSDQPEALVGDATPISAHVDAASRRERVVPVAILLASKAEETVNAAVARIERSPKLRDCLK